MHKFSFLATIALVIMLAMTTPGYCADVTSQNSDAQLKATLQEFMNYHKQQDYKGVWRLLSRNVRDGNYNDQVEYERYFRAHGFHPSEFVVEKIVREDGKALITVSAIYVVNSTGQRYASSREVWTFVREKGFWFFDDYIVLSESP